MSTVNPIGSAYRSPNSKMCAISMPSPPVSVVPQSGHRSPGSALSGESGIAPKRQSSPGQRVSGVVPDSTGATNSSEAGPPMTLLSAPTTANSTPRRSNSPQ
ncbi:MAG: hypothetical protein J07HX64_02616 [halophilic archaeon J07HX64]|nr:MAG: hypothetical protein J07HX64_02616 [halophilic archaeon J07HX64]